MNTNDKLQKLLAIVQKQQKAIEKLAQMQDIPQKYEPVQPELRPQDVVYAHLAPAVKAALRQTMPIVPQGNVLKVFFKPGQASQAAVDHITKVVQALLQQNKLPFAYTVEAVA